MLNVRDLKVSIDGNDILKGLNIEVKPGEVHALMGPNGSGKSTFAKALAGHPAYAVDGGQVELDGEDLLELEPEERAQKGVFMAFQYPVEIPGVTNAHFLRLSYNAIAEARGWDELDPLEFEDYVEDRLDVVKMKREFLERSVNEGFSGGEKKRNEVLQMAILKPRLAILDETDSGLDIDALRIVAEGINQLANEDNAFILVTHYQRILNYVVPDHVHIIVDGRIVRSGGKELALKLEEEGYDWILNEVKGDSVNHG